MPPESLSKNSCPCGSKQRYLSCCQPLLSGEQFARSAEQLMRSRYSAHVTGNIDYLLATWAPEVRTLLDRQAIADWATQAQWLGLEVIQTQAGQADDSEGYVEFIAHYRQDGQLQQHHELSFFRREAGRWLFVDGEPIETPNAHKTGHSSSLKPSRNSACPCGSGKKFKRCCGP